MPEKSYILTQLGYLLIFVPTILAMGLIPYWTLGRFLQRRTALWRRALLLLGCGLTAGMVIQVGDPVNILGTMPFFLLAVWLGTEAAPWERWTVALIFFTIGTSVSAIISNAPLRNVPSFFENLFRVIVWALIWLLFRRLCRDMGELRLEKRHWQMLLGLLAAPFMTMIAGVSLGGFSGDGSQLAVLTLIPFSLLSGLTLLGAVIVLSRQAALERERELAAFSQSYYEQLERQQKQVRTLRHDMANQLQTLAALPESEMKDYLAQLLDSPAMAPSRRYCGHPVVNVILSAKAAQMEGLGIAFDCAAPLPEVLPLHQTDLCAVLCNGLDNAIAACGQLPPEQRWVALRADAQKGLFVLQIKNPCTQPPVAEQGRLRTTKKDAQQHGFGTRSIRDIARKYGGSAEFRWENGQFALMVYMPLTRI